MCIIIAPEKKMVVDTDSFGYRLHEELSAESHFVFPKETERIVRAESGNPIQFYGSVS